VKASKALRAVRAVRAVKRKSGKSGKSNKSDKSGKSSKSDIIGTRKLGKSMSTYTPCCGTYLALQHVEIFTHDWAKETKSLRFR
jgi:hypothetical protein